jgi:hypothetical protein
MGNRRKRDETKEIALQRYFAKCCSPMGYGKKRALVTTKHGMGRTPLHWGYLRE